MNNKKYETGVVGNRDVILPSCIIGFNASPVNHAREAIDTSHQLTMNDCGIVYLTEDIAAKIPDTIVYYGTQVTPAVTLISAHKGLAGLGLQRVQNSVEEAAG